MKKNIKIMLAAAMLLIVLFLNLYPATDGNLTGQPYPEKTGNGFAVVELFTSEGCSSCPPADVLMAKIEKETSGKNVYLLAYHIDYWDRQGWKDSFSSPKYTARQHQYAEWMGLGTMFTPQFVVNGSAQFAGAQQSSLYNLVAEAMQVNHGPALRLEADEGQDAIQVSYQTDKALKNTSLFVALVQKNASTTVARGENGGRLLHHVQIVQELNTMQLDKKDGFLVFSKPEKFNDKQWEVIGFIQNTTTGNITAAARAAFKS